MQCSTVRVPAQGRRGAAGRFGGSFSRSFVAGLCVLGSVVATARVGAADIEQQGILEQVPDNALAIIKIKNLQELSGKVAALAQQFGVAARVADLNDPLAALERQMGIKAGLNKDGAFALVILDSPDAQPIGYALIPVSDFKAFIGNFADAQADGDLMSFTAPMSGKKSYAAQWGGYAAVSAVKEALAKKPTGFKAQGVTGRELDTKDVVLYANMKAVGAKVLPLLKNNREQILDQIAAGMQQGNANIDAKSAAVLKAVFSQYIAGVEEFLGDAQAATFSLNLSREGIATSAMAEFEPGSYLGKLVQGAPAPQANLLAGLPDGKYMFFGGATLDGKAMSQVLDDIAKPIIAEAKNQGFDVKVIDDYLGAIKEAGSAQNHQAFGILAPTGNLGQTSLIQAIVLSTGDAPALLAAQKKMMESEQEVMKLIPNNPAGMVQMTYAEGAKTVDGVKFNAVQVKASGQGKTPVEMQMQQLLTFMYGANGANGYMGAIDDKHVLTAMGVGDDVISGAITAAKGGQDVVGKKANVASVTKNLPQNPCGVMYISLDVIATTVSSFAGQVGLAFPLEVPENLQPIGVAVATEGTAVRIDSYTSAQTIQSLIVAGMQAWLKANGGGNKPGGF